MSERVSIIGSHHACLAGRPLENEDSILNLRVNGFAVSCKHNAQYGADFAKD